MFGAAELGGVHVSFLDAGVDFTEGMSDAAMEQNGVSPSPVEGRTVLEYRDAGPGGVPDWLATGNVFGSDPEQAWILDSSGAIETVTTVPTNFLVVNLQGFDDYDGTSRAGSGKGRILVDGVVKANVDLWHDSEVLGGSTSGSSRNLWNVRVLIRDLNCGLHTIRIEGRGPTDVPEGDDDDTHFSVWGAAVLEPDAVDLDGDGVLACVDNCELTQNSDQRDTDADGYGNVCDADLNNDCNVNPIDLGMFKAVFFTSDADADFDGNGVVNAVDLGIMRTLFFLPPGPSGSGSCSP